jgi:chemotaxis signal transduction protein
MMSTLREDAVASPGKEAPVISFLVGASTRVALVATTALEIVDGGPLTVIPHAPGHVLGIAQVRGRPLPVVDLAPFLDLPRHDRPSGNLSGIDRLVVVAAGSLEVALLGREVHVDDRPRVAPARGTLPYGDAIAEHVVAELETARGIAVLLDLPRVLEAARVRG